LTVILRFTYGVYAKLYTRQSFNSQQRQGLD